MKKFFLFYFLLLLSLILSLPKSILADEQTVPSGLNYQQIGPKVEDYVNRNKDTTAGMETAIFDTKGTIYQGNFGYINKEKKIKADDSTIFEWGSVTKLTIWISVMQQWEQGKIDLDKDIREYLPDNFFKNLHYDKPITMKNLMNHQAGFEDSTHVYRPNEGQNFEQILSTNQNKFLNPELPLPIPITVQV